MPDRDIVLAKSASVQKCLRRIKEVTQNHPESYFADEAQGS